MIGTHGRALYVLDDIRPLRAPDAPPCSPSRSTSSRSPTPASTGRGSAPTATAPTSSTARTGPTARSSPSAAPAGGTAEIHVADASGQRLRTFRWPLDPGVNRLTWGLERDAFKLSPRAAARPPPASLSAGSGGAAGNLHRSACTLGDHEAQQTVRVLPDPRSRNTEADWQARWAAVLRAGHLQDVGITAVMRLRKTRADVEAVAAKIATDAPPEARPALQKAAADLQAKITALEKRLRVAPEMPLGLPRDELVMEKIWAAVDAIQTSMDPPTPTLVALLDRGEKALGAYLVDLNRFYAEDVEAFRKQIAAAGLELVPEAAPVRLE